MVRRDIWLTREVRWKVRARRGDGETGRVVEWEFATEEQARAMVERLIATDDSGQAWKDITDLTTRRPP